MKLACRLIGESCGHLTCLKHANYFSSLSPIKPSRLVNGYNRKSKMVLLRAATTIHNRLNIACGPTYANMIWERIICILAGCGMKDSILFGYAIWWSLQKNVWMCGAHDSSLALIVHKTHWTWTTIECTQIWGSRNLQEAWSIVASIDMWKIWIYIRLKWYSGKTQTIVDVVTTIWTNLVVSLHAQFKNLHGDSESQKLT